MAKFDFRHPFRGIRDIIFGTPERERPQEIINEPPEPPRQPSTGPDYFPPFDNYDFDQRRREIWSEVTGLSETNDSADKGWEIFGDSGAPLNRGYFETNELWDEFLRAFWLDTDDEGFVPRSQYYEDADIEPVLIDWPEWREWRDTP